MLWSPTFLFGTSNVVPSLYSLSKLPGRFSNLDPAFSAALMTSLWFLKVTIKTFCLTFLFYAYSVFLPEVQFCHWLFITKNINCLYTLMKLNIAFVSISKDVWKPIPLSHFPASSAFFLSPAKLFETVIQRLSGTLASSSAWTCSLYSPVPGSLFSWTTTRMCYEMSKANRMF